jgi:hypothetical protein
VSECVLRSVSYECDTLSGSIEVSEFLLHFTHHTQCDRSAVQDRVYAVDSSAQVAVYRSAMDEDTLALSYSTPAFPNAARFGWAGVTASRTTQTEVTFPER